MSNNNKKIIFFFNKIPKKKSSQKTFPTGNPRRKPIYMTSRSNYPSSEYPKIREKKNENSAIGLNVDP